MEIPDGRDAAGQQQILRLEVRAENPVGDGQSEEAGDRFVPRHVGVVVMMEAVDFRPEPADVSIVGRAFPPFVGVVLDRMEDFVRDQRPRDGGVPPEGVDWEGRVLVLFNAGDWVPVQDHMVGLTRDALTFDGREGMVMTMTARKPDEPRMDRLMEDVAVKPPFEERNAQVDQHERSSDHREAGGPLSGPRGGEQPGEDEAQSDEFQPDQKEKSPDRKPRMGRGHKEPPLECELE